MATAGYLLEFPDFKDREKRFAIFNGTFSNLGDLIFVTLAQAGKRNHSHDVLKRIVDTARELAAQGHPQAPWIKSCRIVQYHGEETEPSRRLAQIYPAQVEAKPVTDDLPEIVQIFDQINEKTGQREPGTFRVTPKDYWTQGTRAVSHSYMVRLADGTPFTESVSGSSRMDVISKIISPGFIPGRRIYAESWSFATQAQIDAAIAAAPKPEQYIVERTDEEVLAARTYVYETLQELDEAFRWYDSLPAGNSLTALVYSDRLVEAKIERLLEYRAAAQQAAAQKRDKDARLEWLKKNKQELAR